MLGQLPPDPWPRAGRGRGGTTSWGRPARPGRAPVMRCVLRSVPCPLRRRFSPTRVPAPSSHNPSPASAPWRAPRVSELSQLAARARRAGTRPSRAWVLLCQRFGGGRAGVDGAIVQERLAGGELRAGVAHRRLPVLGHASAARRQAEALCRLQPWPAECGGRPCESCAQIAARMQVLK